MKIQVPTILLGRVLQAASVVYTAASAETTDAVTTSLSHESHDRAIDRELPLSMPNDQIASTALVNFVIPPEWDGGSAARFDELSEKEALGFATSEDIEELDGLSGLRRRAIVPRTGQEVMREYEQGQLIRDLLQSLTRYVEFAKQPADRTSKTRVWTKTKTSGA